MVAEFSIENPIMPAMHEQENEREWKLIEKLHSAQLQA